MGTTPPNVYTVSHVAVQIAGVSDSLDTLLFSSVTPPSWSIDAPKHIFHGDSNMPYPIIGSVQKPTYGTMTLTQGWDQNHVMATWKALMESAQALSAKWKQVTVTWYDSDGQTPIAGWTTEQAILVAYSHAASDASSNGILTVSATLDSVTPWQQTDGKSQITA
ncbi:MAG: phage tail protein [Solirubrobacteraceae bacterium]|jgi:hypothetical protein